MIKLSCIFLIVCLSGKISCFLLANQPSTFRAAVYEHAVVLPAKNPLSPVSRQVALEDMMKNLEVYREQAVLAGQQNVDIMVFPEDGIYGVGFRRQEVEPYLEYIPDPKSISWNPCQDTGRYPHTEVQTFLSCLARNNSLYLVANFGDKQPCSKRDDVRCPDDGHYQYNTDVVHNPSGTLIAKYHKVNLFYEYQFDFPNVSESVTFNTPFGVFGVITCFDIMFHDPVIDLIQNKRVRNIVFPTAWMDALPLLSSIQFHSAFAAGNRLNFLAANINYPLRRFHGSGIYTPNGAKAFYYNDGEPQGKLLISDLQVLREQSHLLTEQSVQLRVQAEQEIFSDRSLSGRNRMDLVVRAEEEFQSLVFNDMFNFRPIVGPSGNVSVCHNRLCCELSYNKENTIDEYAFGAFDGLHTHEGSYYIQVCALLKCNGTDHHGCGQPTLVAETNFHSFKMMGTFRSQYVFPELLLSNNGSLALSMGDHWSYRDNVLESTTGLENPVLSIAMFSRVYTDMDSNGHHGGA